MKRITIIYGIILLSFSCERTNKEKSTNQLQYDNIFGTWKVTHAEFIRGENFLYNSTIDDNGLENASSAYTYRFNSDSTFERGKPNFKHGNVEEAHGRFSMNSNNSEMTWYLNWSHTDRIDTTNIEIVSMTPIKIVLNERMGGGHKMLQILERGKDEI